MSNRSHTLREVEIPPPLMPCGPAAEHGSRQQPGDEPAYHYIGIVRSSQARPSQLSKVVQRIRKEVKKAAKQGIQGQHEERENLGALCLDLSPCAKLRIVSAPPKIHVSFDNQRASLNLSISGSEDVREALSRGDYAPAVTRLLDAYEQVFDQLDEQDPEHKGAPWSSLPEVAAAASSLSRQELERMLFAAISDDPEIADSSEDLMIKTSAPTYFGPHCAASAGMRHLPFACDLRIAGHDAPPGGTWWVWVELASTTLEINTEDWSSNALLRAHAQLNAWREAVETTRP